jgi:hypothetical protein
MQGRAPEGRDPDSLHQSETQTTPGIEIFRIADFGLRMECSAVMETRNPKSAIRN